MIRPPYLKPGDRVAIVAPARKIARAEINAAVDLFRAWQLDVVLPDHLFDADNQFAGDDPTRALTLQRQLDDPAVRAIFCARGGYGTVRIVDRLDFTHFCQHPKWIVGYSDITVLHSHIHRHLGIETLHATMPLNIPPDALSTPYPAIDTLRRALFGEKLSYTLPPHPLDRTGTAHGQLVGGNLSILYSLCGSPSDLDTDGKILFIEDLDEYLYHIDRMMMNLKRCGRLARLAGLIVGQMSDMHDNTIPFGSTAEQIIRHAVSAYSYPVCFNFPAGHNGTDNHALTLGHPATLAVTPTRSTLTL
jgi:muramoyltetrapeptide carboxypeptidase